MEHYKINIGKREIEDIICELKGMKIPCIINIYDRVFQLDTKEELRMFIYGCEVGNYVAMDKRDALR